MVWSDIPRSADRDATDLPAADRSRTFRRNSGGYLLRHETPPFGGSAHHQFEYADSGKLGYHLSCPPYRVNLRRYPATHHRTQAGITLTQAAHHLDTRPTLISRLERSFYHNHDLATRYQQWINSRQPTCTK